MPLRRRMNGQRLLIQRALAAGLGRPGPTHQLAPPKKANLFRRPSRRPANLTPQKALTLRLKKAALHVAVGGKGL